VRLYPRMPVRPGCLKDKPLPRTNPPVQACDHCK